MNPTDERFSRLGLLLGEEGLAQLNKAKVMVLGLGGVGGSCCEALARGGVASLVLIDRDVVELSNINRQAIAFSSTIGQAKVEVAEWCARHEVPLLSAMGAANKIDPQFLTFSTIEKT